MNLGYSHQVTMSEVEGITIDVPEPEHDRHLRSLTSRRSASLQRKSARSVRRNPIRARAFATLTSMSAARKARPALRRSKERRGENKWFRRRIPTRRVCSATSAYALRSTAPLIVPVWTYSVPQRTSMHRSSTTSPVLPLVSASTAEKDFTEYGGNKEAAKKIGQLVAERCKAKGIETSCLTAAAMCSTAA